MPLYEYECESCGARIERIQQKFSDPLLQTCPTCAGQLRKLISSPAIQFKGSGFYITDYARKSGSDDKSASDAKGEKDAKDAKGEKGESKGAKDDSKSSKGDSGSSTESASPSKPAEASPSAPAPAKTDTKS